MMRETTPTMTETEKFDFWIEFGPEHIAKAARYSTSMLHLRFRGACEFHTHIKQVQWMVRGQMNSPLFQDRKEEVRPVLAAWEAYLVAVMPVYGTVGFTAKRWARAVEIIVPLAEALGYDITHLTSFAPLNEGA